jgi:hypothetical protein
MNYLLLAIIVSLTAFMTIGTVALIWDTTVQWIEETKREKNMRQALENYKAEYK